MRVVRDKSPFGVDFEVIFTTGIAVRASENVIKLLENKKMLLPGESPPDSWKIVESAPAVEEVLFEDKRIGMYLIRD